MGHSALSHPLLGADAHSCIRILSNLASRSCWLRCLASITGVCLEGVQVQVLRYASILIKVTGGCVWAAAGSRVLIPILALDGRLRGLEFADTLRITTHTPYGSDELRTIIL